MSKDDLQGASPEGTGLSPSGLSPSVSSAAAASIPRAGLEALETMLRSLLKGEHTSLLIGFNDCNAPNYMSVRDYLADEGPGTDTDWVSDEECTKAIETNSWWTAHWYPNTPVGFNSLSAASLSVLIAALHQEAPAIEARRAENATAGSVEDESAIANGEAPDSIDRLKRENAELREALRPFAEEAEQISKAWPYMTDPGMCWHVEYRALDRARTLLSQSPEGGETK